MAGVRTERDVIGHHDVAALDHPGTLGRGRRSATSFPSKDTRSCVASQNGLRLDAPHRHSQRPGASIGVGSVQPIGSPNSVSTCAVRTSGGEPVTS